MKMISFEDLVQRKVSQYMAKWLKFSAKDITESVRKEVNGGHYGVLGVSPEVVSGVSKPTYPIDYLDVKDALAVMFDRGDIQGYIRGYEQTSSGTTYRTYKPLPAMAQTVSVALQKKSSAPRIPSKTSRRSDIVQIMKNYLAADDATAKRIQSRMKRNNPPTCAEIVSIAQTSGFRIVQNSAHPSKVIIGF